MKKKVLFLCTGNSCRSQMAEGIVRHLMSDKIEPYSAGLIPSIVSPYAIKVMEEIGIDISEQWSKHINELIEIPFDLVVTVCDHAKEYCPVLPGAKKTVHIPFRDPISAIGTLDEILEEFRKIRDQIREQIPEVLERELPS